MESVVREASTALDLGGLGREVTALFLKKDPSQTGVA
jgi:hypothetical protein